MLRKKELVRARPLDEFVLTPSAASTTSREAARPPERPRMAFASAYPRSDFRETESLQKGPACNVLRKHAAGELVQAGGGSRLDQPGEHRATGAAAAIIAPHIDREFPDAAVAGTGAIGEGSGQCDGSRLPGFVNDHKRRPGEPLGDLSGRARLGLV